MERSMAVDEEVAAELVFITISAMGHLPSAARTAQNLAARFPERISITFLIVKFPVPDSRIESFIQFLKSGNGDNAGTAPINVIELPEPENPPAFKSTNDVRPYIEAHKPIVKRLLLEKNNHHHHQSINNPRKLLAGLVLDMSCTSMIDVANELRLPSYIFYPSGSAFLRLTVHFGHFGVPPNVDTHASLPNDEPMLELAGFRNPVPSKVWPDLLLEAKSGEWAKKILESGRMFRETKGILINTFTELESDLIDSLTSDNGRISPPVPPIYTVGPIINPKSDSVNNNADQKNGITDWLDSQPDGSVVFLCFGSRGTFDESQVREIAAGLERSGQRFLWSLRRKLTAENCKANVGMISSPEEYDDFSDVLPEGFLSRTAGIGRVIGWAPQAMVLGHRAVGAFVSHCGWNSTLESLWFGVPLVAWPMYAEQQLNAFVLLKELGLAVEIKMDYKVNFYGEAEVVVGAEVIEKALRKVMEEEDGKRLREKTAEMSNMAKKSLEIGGSSYESMSRFTENVFKNIP